MFLSLWNSHFDQFLFQKLYYLDYPVHFLFTSCSFPLHSYLYFLFIAYSFLFILIHFFSFPIYFLFIAYSFPFHVHSFFHCLWPEKFTTVPKSNWFSLINLLFKNYLFQAPNQLGYSFPVHFTSFHFQSFSKKWFIKGVVNKVWGLDG